MTSLADQTETEMGGPWSILTRQKRDHVRLDELLHLVGETTGTEQDSVLRETWRLVFPHAFAEESVLFPEYRRLLPDGADLTLQIEQEHQEVNELVTRLEELPVDDPERQQVLDRVVVVLREDVRDEEDQLLPRLQEVLDHRRLRQLGVTWEAVRRVAPTRPHPVVARRPPGNALAALPLTVLDRSRDRLDQVASTGPVSSGPWQPRLVATSQALARVAGRVEHLPAFTRGEDASTHRA